MSNNFQKQIIELKKAKLALEERRLSLEEMRFARPSIPVPIILPDASEAQNSKGQWRLLGDSGYPLRPYLFTPVANPVSNSEADFNEAHHVARSIVERTLGSNSNIAVWARVPLDIREEDEEVEEENEICSYVWNETSTGNQRWNWRGDDETLKEEQMRHYIRISSSSSSGQLENPKLELMCSNSGFVVQTHTGQKWKIKGHQREFEGSIRDFDHSIV
ncbi:unnamed protein product [Leuciscus chuanchicus]